MNKEMQRALVADGEKLKAMTGKDHGPWEYPDSSGDTGMSGESPYDRLKKWMETGEAPVAYKVCDGNFGADVAHLITEYERLMEIVRTRGLSPPSGGSSDDRSPEHRMGTRDLTESFDSGRRHEAQRCAKIVCPDCAKGVYLDHTGEHILETIQGQVSWSRACLAKTILQAYAEQADGK